MNKKYVLAIMWTLCVAMCVTTVAALCLFVLARVQHGALRDGLALTRYIVNISIPLLGICAMLSFIAYRRLKENEKLGTIKK